jgi:hypothetical protein
MLSKYNYMKVHLLIQICPELKPFKDFLAEDRHFWLERKDAEDDQASINTWLTSGDDNDNKRRKAFLLLHIKVTTPFSGEWKYSKANKVQAE